MKQLIKLVPAFLMLFLMVQVPATAGTMSAKDAASNMRSEYKAMSKTEKKAFRQNLRQKFKEIRKQRKGTKQNLSLDPIETTGLVIAIGGLAVAIIAGALGLGLIAGLGGLMLLIGVVILVLGIADVI